MATISIANAYGTVSTNPRLMDNTKAPYIVWREVDLAAAATAKGSALAASDVIEVLRVPDNVVLLGGWAVKTAALTGTVSVLTLNVGVTGVNATEYGSAWDAYAATVGGYSTPGAMTPRVITSTDTVDVTIASLTGTLTGGKIRVAVMVVDATTDDRGSIAQPKS